MATKLNLQMFGGRGASSGISGGGGGGGGSSGFNAKAGAALSAMNENRRVDFEDALRDLPVGTKIYDGSKTITDTQGGKWGEHDTYYELTNKYDNGSAYWTLFGDKNNYTPQGTSKIAQTIWRKKNNPNFNLKITK